MNQEQRDKFNKLTPFAQRVWTQHEALKGDEEFVRYVIEYCLNSGKPELAKLIKARGGPIVISGPLPKQDVAQKDDHLAECWIEFERLAETPGLTKDERFAIAFKGVDPKEADKMKNYENRQARELVALKKRDRAG